MSVSLQAKYHLCSAGWLESGRVAYPTAYASPNCGSGIVGIVDYGPRPNKSEMWDVFCYRMKGNCPSYTSRSRPCSGWAVLSLASQSPRVSRTTQVSLCASAPQMSTAPARWAMWEMAFHAVGTCFRSSCPSPRSQISWWYVPCLLGSTSGWESCLQVAVGWGGVSSWKKLKAHSG
jgi:hypothetical protein